MCNFQAYIDFCLVTILKLSSHTLQVSDDLLGSGLWYGMEAWPREGRAQLSFWVLLVSERL